MRTVRDILMDIRERHGVLTPAIVLEEARPEDSPIHGFVFHVDIAEAAEGYYLERAHRLIQIAKVTVKERENEPARRVRAFVGIPSEDSGYVYEPIGVVVTDAEKLSRARFEAVRRLREAESAVEDLDAYAAGSVLQKSTKRAAKAIRAAREELSAA